MKRNHPKIAAAVLILASCNQAEVSNVINDSQVINASISVPETRTHLTADDYELTRQVLWSEGDKILISGNSEEVFITTDNGKSTASFFPEDGSSEIDFSQGIIAVYPAEGTYMNGADPDKEIYLTIPNVQEYAEDSFAEGAMPMISDVTYGPEVNFRNAAGVIRLLVSTNAVNVKASSIIIKTNELIASEIGGDMCYIPSQQEYNFDPDYTFAVNSIKIDCGDGVHIDSDGTPFHIVVPHQTYTGMEITINTTDGEKQVFTMKEGKEITVKRSGISTIPLEISGLVKPTVSIEQTSSTYKNISVSIKMENVNSFYCGIYEKKAFESTFRSGALAREAKYGVLYEAKSDPMTYTGSAFSFQTELKDVLIEPGQNYVMWILPYKDNGTYDSEDFVYTEIFTQKLKAGGTQTISYSDLFVDQTTISMTLSSEGATLIYASLVDGKTMSGLETKEDMISYLISPGSPAVIYEGNSETFERKQLSPGTKMTLLALPVNFSGMYGELFVKSFTTKTVPYNHLIVHIDESIAEENDKEYIRWSVSEGEATGYRYILKETDSYLWTNTLHGSVKRTQETMFMTPDLYYINKTSDNYVEVSGLVPGTEYILVVTATDENDTSSIADSWTFTY